MTRTKLANQYLAIVRALLGAIEHESSRARRESAVQEFRAKINPVTQDWMSASTTQNISNDLATNPVQRKSGEQNIQALFWAIHALARAGKEAAPDQPELAAHYLKSAIGIGPMWVQSTSTDTSA